MSLEHLARLAGLSPPNAWRCPLLSPPCTCTRSDLLHPCYVHHADATEYACPMVRA